MANKIYVAPETSLLFNGEASGITAAWSVEGLATASGRVAAQWDRGTGSKPAFYHAQAKVQWQATPTQYGSLDIYAAFAHADSTVIDGDVGASDAALGDVDQLKNLIHVLSVIAEEADTTVMVASRPQFYIPARYVSLVAYNTAGATINATDSNFKFWLTPTPFEVQ